MNTTEQRRRILVTNDDGIDSVGLHTMARALLPLGDVVVVAPDREYSGSSASLGTLADMEPVVRRHSHGAAEGYEAWSLAGPPALCVLFARLGVFGAKFDLIVSGINPGANVGRAIYHSGTVGAATTARLGGISSIAISQEVDTGSIEGQAQPGFIINQHWETAAEVAACVAETLLDELPAEPVLLNINVPNLPRQAIRGWRRATISSLPSRGLKSATLEPIDGRPGSFRGVMVWGDMVDLPPESDAGALAFGEVVLTWLSPFMSASPPIASAAEQRVADYLGPPAIKPGCAP